MRKVRFQVEYWLWSFGDYLGRYILDFYKMDVHQVATLMMGEREKDEDRSGWLK